MINILQDNSSYAETWTDLKIPPTYFNWNIWYHQSDVRVHKYVYTNQPNINKNWTIPVGLIQPNTGKYIEFKKIYPKESRPLWLCLCLFVCIFERVPPRIGEDYQEEIPLLRREDILRNYPRGIYIDGQFQRMFNTKILRISCFWNFVENSMRRY